MAEPVRLYVSAAPDLKVERELLARMDFVRHLAAQSTWRRSSHLADLGRQVLELLSRHLLDHADRHGLSPREFDRLRDWRSELASEQDEVASESRGEAGESSVILSVQRFEPSEGVLIQDQENREGEADD
jgi:hypothetical protein